MKKQITILILLIIPLFFWSQKPIPTNGPCTDELLLKVKGKWVKYPDNISAVTKTEQQEAFNRLDQIKDMLIKIHPDPIGFDVSWNRSIGVSYFGAKHKYSNNENDRPVEIYNLPPMATFGLIVDDRFHYCDNANKNMMWTGETNQSPHSGVSVTVNNIEISVGGGGGEWTINGLPVKMRNPVLAEKWKGYDIQWPEYGSTARHVLIHRKGILPYRPVTRKQYLDQCLVVTAKPYDKMIEGVKQTPVRSLEEQEKEKKAQLAQYEKDFGKNTAQYKSAADYYLSGYQTDQQRRDEQLKNIIKTKEDELKKFKDELEKTIKEELLDSPAVVLGMYFSDIVFETNPEKGFMLVTENPDYIRKDLPKNVPQVFILSWSSWEDKSIPEKNIAKAFEKDFPIEKLQAMIDK